MRDPKFVPTTRAARRAGRPVPSQTAAPAGPEPDDRAETPQDGDDGQSRVPAVPDKPSSRALSDPKPAKLRERRKRKKAQLEEYRTPGSVVNLQGLSTPVVPMARPERRHWLLALSFLLIVLLPAAAAIAYLYTRAVDSYASTAAFSVHMEDNAGAAGLLSGMSALGVPGVQSPDADILQQFIQSQSLVETIDERLDLRAMFSAHHETDPIFSLSPDATLEQLVGYWRRVVTIILEPDTGLVTIEVRAFTPEDAQLVAGEILAESGALIDELSKIARDDTLRLAREELAEAEARLKEVRLDVAKFRDVEQIVDPTADLAGQMGVINALQQSLAEAMIRRDMLIGTTTNDDDPRLQQADRSIQAIRTRIADEREKIGARQTEGSDDPLSRVVGEYEELLVDREFAEQSYLAAMAAFDGAVAEARRKSRYLAVHIPPTRAQTAIYPQRVVLSIMAVSLLALLWALFILIAYSVRDRR